MALRSHEDYLMKRPALPPLVGGIKNGEITWEKIESVDHETLGYLLSCHLIIEHYVTEVLKSANWRGDELQWGRRQAVI
jgi:hypothetical protein